MYRFKERASARDPLRDAIASLRMVRVFKVAIEAMIVDCCASNIVRSAMRDSVISIDDVITVRRL